jgi:ADP-heptose:LPS heptosyltransferase
MSGAGTGLETAAAGDRPRVLIPRPDHLGDLLLTLPAIRALRRRLPRARVACLVPTELVPIAERAADVDEVLVMAFPISRPAPMPRSAALESAAAPLRGQFDLAVLTRPNDPWSGALAASAGVPLRVGHQQPGTVPFLTHAFSERPSRHVSTEAVVLTLRAAALLRPRGPRATRRLAPMLHLLPGDRRAARDVVADGSVKASPPIVVHPTGGWRLKSWPVERWGAVIAAVAELTRSSVLVVGRPLDKPWLDEIADAAGGMARPLHEIPLGTLAALHARARVVVGIDSGALHLAALVGAPVVGLFGPFAPRRVAPLASPDRSRALWGSLACSPCGTLEAPPCGATHDPACLLGISSAHVVESVIEVARRR